MKTIENVFSGTPNWFTKAIKGEIIPIRFLILGVVGVFLLIIGGVYDSSAGKPKAVQQSSESTVNTPKVPARDFEDLEEAKLSNLLSQIRGAGTVSVSVTYETGSTQEHAKNITKESKVIQEKDNNGGVRTTTETKENEQILMSKENGADHPVMVREIKPVIKGVVVVADGAYDSTVKANLTRAVEAGLGIPSYKITVLPQRK